MTPMFLRAVLAFFAYLTPIIKSPRNEPGVS